MVILNGRVDAEATTSLRADRNAKRTDDFFGFSPGRVEFERRWPLPAYNKLTEVLGRLPVSWRFYAKQKIFEALESDCPAEEAIGPDAVQQAYVSLLDQQPRLKNQLEMSE